VHMLSKQMGARRACPVNVAGPASDYGASDMKSHGMDNDARSGYESCLLAGKTGSGTALAPEPTPKFLLVRYAPGK